VAVVVVLVQVMVLLVVLVAVTVLTLLSRKIFRVVLVQPCRVLTAVLLRVTVTHLAAVVAVLVL
jgi:hypothetical protein